MSAESPTPQTVDPTPGEPGPGTGRPARGGGSSRGTFARVAAVVVFLLIFGPIYGAWLGSSFLDSGARFFDIYQNTPAMIVAVGLVVCLVAGQFDLSIGSMVTLSVFMTIGLRVNQGLPFGLVLVLVVVMGIAGGLINGLLVVKVRVNAFIATLATGGVYEGISNVYSDGAQLTQNPGSPRLPGWFNGLTSFGSFQSKAPAWLSWLTVIVLLGCVALVVLERWPKERRDARFQVTAGVITVLVAAILVIGRGFTDQVPQEAIFLAAIAVVVWVLMRYTAYGRSMYAIGGNPTAARLAGIKVDRYTIIAFMITGMLAAVAGIVLAANQGTAVPGIGTPYLLPAYAAVFLSTVILSDGRFHVWGTVAGSLSVIFIAQGLIIGGVPFTWNQVINGVVLAVAVAFATVLRGRQT
jgi:ribose/xylose/arabinose/galactoside ABC-type transport system permease subunit